VTSGDETRAALTALRARFDDVDAQILALLAQRAALSREAGTLKQAKGLAIVDVAREHAAADARRVVGRGLGLDDDIVDDVFSAIVLHSRRVQGAR
jgi:chorismate mutase/prephenate dehydrogenase